MRLPVSLDNHSSAIFPLTPSQSPSQQAPRIALNQQSGPFDFEESGPCLPAAHMLLDHDTACAQLLRPQLLQIGHLAGHEEDLRLAELVLLTVGD